MKASDTIIPIEERVKFGVWHGREKLAQAQAEISFKAGNDEGYKNGQVAGYNEATQKAIESWKESLLSGRELGIKEVMEWIDNTFSDSITKAQMMATNTWQAKLKELGLEAGK